MHAVYVGDIKRGGHSLVYHHMAYGARGCVPRCSNHPVPAWNGLFMSRSAPCSVLALALDLRHGFRPGLPDVFHLLHRCQREEARGDAAFGKSVVDAYAFLIVGLVSFFMRILVRAPSEIASQTVRSASLAHPKNSIRDGPLRRDICME